MGILVDCGNLCHTVRLYILYALCNFVIHVRDRRVADSLKLIVCILRLAQRLLLALRLSTNPSKFEQRPFAALICL